jgi:hypothetical protein
MSKVARCRECCEVKDLSDFCEPRWDDAICKDCDYFNHDPDREKEKRLRWGLNIDWNAEWRLWEDFVRFRDRLIRSGIVSDV